MADRLFASLERFYEGRPGAWDRVLDAGTGDHSLQWLRSRAPRELVAVTGAQWRVDKMPMAANERLLLGNWQDESLLHGEVFDHVLADYLLGAIDGFAPYFQDQLFARLRRHVGGWLSVIGLEPFPDHAQSEGARCALAIARMRDACILLAGHRCYREYPLSWVLRSLERSGYAIEDSWSMPIVYRERWVNSQLDVCKRKLPHLPSRDLAREMERSIEALRERSLRAVEIEDGLRLGSDWVVVARAV